VADVPEVSEGPAWPAAATPGVPVVVGAEATGGGVVVAWVASAGLGDAVVDAEATGGGVVVAGVASAELGDAVVVVESVVPPDAVEVSVVPDAGVV